jgi:hypothetical protein
VDRDAALECAVEAMQAHGNTGLTDQWWRRWLPEDYAANTAMHLRRCAGCCGWHGGRMGHHLPGLPTTVQMSLSCFLMERAVRLISASDTD